LLKKLFLFALEHYRDHFVAFAFVLVFGEAGEELEFFGAEEFFSKARIYIVAFFDHSSKFENFVNGLPISFFLLLDNF